MSWYKWAPPPPGVATVYYGPLLPTVRHAPYWAIVPPDDEPGSAETWAFGWPMYCVRSYTEARDALMTYAPAFASGSSVGRDGVKTTAGMLVLIDNRTVQESSSSRAPQSHAGLVWLPTGVMWAPFAVNTLFFAVIFFAVWSAFIITRETRRRMRGHCARCNYDRSTLPLSALCPECGSAWGRLRAEKKPADGDVENAQVSAL